MATFTLDTSTLNGADVLGSTVLTMLNAFPTLIVEVGFTNNALDDPVTWTDITKYVRAAQISRGRQHELNRFEAGTASVVVSNRDGRFSPFNGSSAYSPNVLPFKPIRIRATWNGQTYPVFRGFVEAWPVKWSTAADSDVTITAVDATKMLNLRRPTDLNTAYPTAVNALSPYLYWRLNDAPGSASVIDSSTNGRTGTVFTQTPLASGGPLLPFQLGVSGALAASTATGVSFGSYGGEVYLYPSSTIDVTTSVCTAWVNIQTPAFGSIFSFTNAAGDRALRLSINNNGTLGVFATSPGAPTNQISYNGVRNLADGNWHYVVMATTSTTSGLYIDGVLDASSGMTTGTALSLTGQALFEVGGASAIPTLTPNAAQIQAQEVAIFLSSLSQSHLNLNTTGRYPLSSQTTGQRVQSLLTSVGWPASLTQLDGGASVVQSAASDAVSNSVLSSAQTVSDTEGGALFIAADGSVTFYSRYHTSQAPFTMPQVVLGDSGVLATEEPYDVASVDIQFDDLDLYNEAVVTPAGYGAQTASDSSSQTTYGKRSLSITGVHATLSDALGQAQFNVGIYKNPLQRVRSVSFTPLSDTDILFKAALGFELLTRVKLIRRPIDGSGSTFSQEALIEGVTHEIVAGEWRTTWRLSPTAALSMFLLDKSTLDGADLLGW